MSNLKKTNFRETYLLLTYISGPPFEILKVQMSQCLPAERWGKRPKDEGFVAKLKSISAFLTITTYITHLSEQLKWIYKY